MVNALVSKPDPVSVSNEFLTRTETETDAKESHETASLGSRPSAFGSC